VKLLQLLILLLSIDVMAANKAKKSEIDLCDQLAKYTCDMKAWTRVADDTGEAVSGNPDGEAETLDMAKQQIVKGIGTEIDQLIQGWRKENKLPEQMTELGFTDKCMLAQPMVSSCLKKFRSHTRRIAIDDILVGPGHQKEPAQQAIYHLWNDPEYQTLRDKFKDAGINPAAKKSYDQDLKPWFEQVKLETKEAIRENFTGETSSLLLSKIDEVKFGGTDCRTHKLASIFDYAANNAHFDTITKEVKICAGFAERGNSAYTLIHVLGHELGHSIDPCNSVSKSFKTASSPPVPNSKLAYPALVQCLEKKTSIEAKALSNEDNPNDKSVNYCNHQATEAFSDWIGTEVLARMHAKGQIGGNEPSSLFWGLTNAFRGMCETSKKQKKVLAHPETVDRIQKLLAVHPYFRKNLGCRPAPKTEYCNPKQYSPAFLHLQGGETQPARN
jgi:hypothetical protein